MRKLFLLLSALVLSLFANAAVININTGTADALRTALHYANNGDEIIMAAGTYVESNSNFIAFDGKDVLVRAEEGAEVIIQPKVPIIVANGGCAHFQNVKIDASHLNDIESWYEHIIYAQDAVANNRIVLEGCEIYNFALNKSLISCSSASTLDALTINNCYFHNINKSCVFIENTSNAIAINITNSTFANITTVEGSYWAGVIDTRATSGSLLVDHCTFYDVQVMSTDYAAIGKVATPGAVVSNCIFVQPSAVDNVRAIRDVAQANNCLTFNYLKDSGKGIHSDVAKNNCIFADPLFADAANGNFSLANNWVTMTISPAVAAATDGSDLGDPRWYTAETLPSTNFASPYPFVGAKALITGNIWYDGTNDYLYYNDKSECGTATWKFHAEKACVLGIAVNLNSGNTSGHKLRVEVLDADGNSVAEFAEQGSTLPGTLIIPSIGDYKIILHDDQTWSSAKIDNVTLSYIGGEVQAMPGTTNIADAWFSANGTRADGKISFPGSTIQDGWVKWNVSFANTGNYDVTLNINSNNCKNYTVALVDANDANVVTPLTLNDCSTTGTPVALTMGAMEVPAGNYILKVTNATQNSDAELISVNFAYTGGGIIDIPGTIALNEAILSERAFIDGDGLHFVDAEHLWLMSEGYAKWNIHVAADGIYKFTANCNSSNYSNLTIQVLQGGEEKYTYTPEYSYSGEKTIVSPEWFLEAGNYELKLSNPANNSNGYLVSLIATAEENVFIMDENTTDDGSIAAAAAAGILYKFLLKRSFTAGRYYTICIPVSSWNDELKLAFGADYELWKMSSATQSGDEISLNFEQCNTESFHAGWPYLIKPSIDVENPTFYNKKTIQNSTYNNVQSFAAADFIGSFYKTVIPAGESNLFLQDNNLYYSETNDTPIKGTRAWIQLKQSGSLAPARARIVLLNQVVTNIQLAEPEENKAIKTIENGQLIIIRDGVRYNAMGVVMK